MTDSFVSSGKLPDGDDNRQPRAVKDDQPICAFAFDLGQVTQPTTRQVMTAYDEIDSIKYFGKPLPPYWRRNGDGPPRLLGEADAMLPGDHAVPF